MKKPRQRHLQLVADPRCAAQLPLELGPPDPHQDALTGALVWVDGDWLCIALTPEIREHLELDPTRKVKATAHVTINGFTHIGVYRHHVIAVDITGVVQIRSLAL